MLTDPQFLDATSDLQRLAILQAAEEQGTYVSPLTADCFKDATEDIQRLEILRAIQGITGGGGGGGGGAFGAIYYFNRSNASSISGYYEMSKNLVIGAGTTLTATGAGTQLVGSFATVLNDPNVTTIPSGNWNFENYVSMSSNGGTPKIYGEIYVRNLAGTETLIATNVSNPHPITSGTLNELYLWSIPVPATIVLATDRLVVKFYALDLTGRTMTMHFEDANVAQTTTSLPSVDLSAYVLKTGDTMSGQLVLASTGVKFNDNTVQTTAAVTSVAATSPITSSGGATPTISTSMTTNRLLGRSTVGTGVAEQITIGTGLSLTAGTLTNSALGTKTISRFTPRENQPPATDFATLDTRNSIAVLDFDDTTNENAIFLNVISEAVLLGSGLKILLIWTATTATTGNCVWQTALEKMTTDIDTDSFDTAESLTATTNVTSGVPNYTEITLTTIDSIVSGDGFRLKVTRNATSASDTMIGDAELIAVEVRSVA